MDVSKMLIFLSELASNNNKDWFDANRMRYELIKEELKIFAEKIIKRAGEIDPNLGVLEAKNCLFRINRDVRFSPNKEPYKTNIGLSITRGGKKSTYAGCYLHIQPNNQSFIAGGLYMPEKEVLYKVRQEIDYKPKDFEKIVENKDFKKYFGCLTGDKLSKTPKGFEDNQAHSEWLKHKSFLGWQTITDKDIKKLDLQNYFLKMYEVLLPLNNFLNKAIDFQE